MVHLNHLFIIILCAPLSRACDALRLLNDRPSDTRSSNLTRYRQNHQGRTSLQISGNRTFDKGAYSAAQEVVEANRCCCPTRTVVFDLSF